MGDTNSIVFIVDDDPSVRKGLERLLRSMNYNVKTYESAQEFLQTAPDCNGPGCMVLDVQMPGLNGMELQKQLQQKGYTRPIVFITGHGDIPMSVRAMKTGAVDFLSKPFDDKDLLNAVQDAIEKDIENRSAMHSRETTLQKIKTLTPREHEIFTYVITGMLNKQIAYDLDISEKTVKVHRGRVMEKLNVDSVADLVRLAGKAGVEPAMVTDI